MALTYFVIFVLIKHLGVFKNSFVRVHAIHIELELRKCWIFEEDRKHRPGKWSIINAAFSLVELLPGYML